MIFCILCGGMWRVGQGSRREGPGWWQQAGHRQAHRTNVHFQLLRRNLVHPTWYILGGNMGGKRMGIGALLDTLCMCFSCIRQHKWWETFVSNHVFSCILAPPITFLQARSAEGGGERQTMIRAKRQIHPYHATIQTQLYFIKSIAVVQYHPCLHDAPRN